MKIFVATFESRSGCGSQKIFPTRKKAEEWLYKKYKKSFDNKSEMLFNDWCEHGAWTCKIKQFTIKD